MKVYPLLLVVALFTACSSVPPQTQAIHKALTTNLALRSATVKCVGLANATERQVKQKYSSWWQRNRQFVQAADYGLLKLNWDASQPATEEQHAVLGMQQLELLMLDSQAQLAEWLGAEASDKSCLKLFDQVGEGDLDLDRRRDDTEVLNALFLERAAYSADVDAARAINARYRKYGRSLYIVEEALRKTGCGEPTISMLRNSWPLEVYDAVCEADNYRLVECVWGRCEVKP